MIQRFLNSGIWKASINSVFPYQCVRVCSVGSVAAQIGQDCPAASAPAIGGAQMWTSNGIDTTSWDYPFHFLGWDPSSRSLLSPCPLRPVPPVLFGRHSDGLTLNLASHTFAYQSSSHQSRGLVFAMHVITFGLFFLVKGFQFYNCILLMLIAMSSLNMYFGGTSNMSDTVPGAEGWRCSD